MAEKALGRRKKITAGELLVRASLLCHFGGLVELENVAQREAAMARKVELYRRALPLLEPPGERLEIPYDKYRMPAVLRKPRGTSRPPVIIIVPGADSTKEEYYFLEYDFLCRGIATLAIDGPGQGEIALCAPVPQEFERPVGAVLDHLQGRDDLNGGCVGIYGKSLGGYLAARAAAFEKRLRCCISAGGVFDMVQTWDVSPLRVRKNLARCLHMDDLESARELVRRYTLRGVAQKIRCALLIVHGSEDTVCPIEGARELYEIAGTRDKELVIYKGGNHVCDNMHYRSRPLIADWTAEKLGTVRGEV